MKQRVASECGSDPVKTRYVSSQNAALVQVINYSFKMLMQVNLDLNTKKNLFSIECQFLEKAFLFVFVTSRIHNVIIIKNRVHSE